MKKGTKLKIVISSGKGGTGKTFIATNLAYLFNQKGRKVRYLDCDVEEPNGHLFLKPKITHKEDVAILSPVAIDEKKCIKCGKCADACRYNAIAVIAERVLLFKQLCHICGACKIVCPENAIIEEKRKIGILKHGKSGKIDFHYGLLETGEGGMTVRLIKKVKEYIGEGINIIDSAPGTSCPVVETVKDADLCVLVTDPTPFGINDLKIAVDMVREIGQEPVVLVNRADYWNDDLKKYCIKADLKIIGEIPDDRKIAEVYSVGDIVVDKLPQYKEVFEDISSKILKMANQKRVVKTKKVKEAEREEKKVKNVIQKTNLGERPKEFVIISGKGGTGKTSICAAFAALAKNIVISDCDVDAADLHLILRPQIKQKGDFSGGMIAEIGAKKCTGCGECERRCQFSAIKKEMINKKFRYSVDHISCEGCGVCDIVCRYGAVKMHDAINGEWFISDTRFGPMSHAKLAPAEENSGKLVSLVRNNEAQLSRQINKQQALIDGSPGTGCPVISSLVGAKYAIVVTEPTVSGIHDMERIVALTKHFNIPVGVIVNKYDLNVNMTEKIKNLIKQSGIEFLGTILYDKSVTEAQIKKLSVVEYTKEGVTKDIIKIWNGLKTKWN